MPLYEYRCTQCGRTSEVRHGFDEAYDEPCSACGAPLRRVFSAAPVVFKGSGFYVTDSRSSPAKRRDGAKDEGPKKPETAKAESPKPESAEPKSPAKAEGAAKSSESAA
jgi:putative FmdB family regulatory protein